MLKTTYTLSEAADLLSCHKETLRRAIMDGQLQAARLGRGWRISRIDLEAFWASKGGGELFPRDEPVITRREETELSELRKTGKRGKKNAPNQLLLPTGPFDNNGTSTV